jgi:hypothetical protein
MEEIALMLGWFEKDIKNIWYRKDDISIYVIYSEHNNYPHQGLPFKRDWNWLMEAVEFIEKLDNYYVQIEEKTCYIYDISLFDNEQTNAFIIKDGEDKKDAVFLAVSEFAKFYNQLKKDN